MKDDHKKSKADLSSYSHDASKEGFCAFYNAVLKETKVYYAPKKTFTQIPEKSVCCVGYMAYPNPTFKNQIPAAKFYEYSKIQKVSSDVPALKFDYKTSGKLEQSVTKAEYIKKIQTIKELLAAGEIYQLNYAIRFRKKFSGNPYHLYLKLLKDNATQFSVFLNAGDFQIISHSPERLFKVEKNKIITQPIKGTARKKELLLTPKTRAELDMITDLERNDIGKICDYGTLKLTQERAVMGLPNLWHTYSEVQGGLPKNIRHSQIIRAMFPGGSITGCPKKRAMEYIEKLEDLPRNIFTGSLFFMNPKTFEASICIRTALVYNGYIEYWAGGGIVADSDPESEYAECMLKAEKFLEVID